MSPSSHHFDGLHVCQKNMQSNVSALYNLQDQKKLDFNRDIDIDLTFLICVQSVESLGPSSYQKNENPGCFYIHSHNILH